MRVSAVSCVCGGGGDDGGDGGSSVPLLFWFTTGQVGKSCNMTEQVIGSVSLMHVRGVNCGLFLFVLFCWFACLGCFIWNEQSFVFFWVNF